MKRLGWLKSVFFFVVIVIVLALCWEGYKLLASEDGQFLAGTAQVKSGNERAPGPLCAGMGLCEIKLPIRADNRSMPPIKNMIATIFEPPRRGSDNSVYNIIKSLTVYVA